MRRWPTVVVVVVAGGLLAGCAQVEDQVSDLADQARSAAAERVASAREQVEGDARQRLDEAIEQWGGDVDVDAVCEMVRDRRLTDNERRSLEFVRDHGLKVGLPFPLVQAAEAVMRLNDNATDEQVNTMIEACREVGARTMPDTLPTEG